MSASCSYPAQDLKGKDQHKQTANSAGISQCDMACGMYSLALKLVHLQPMPRHALRVRLSAI